MRKIPLRQAIVDVIDETDPGNTRYEGQMRKWGMYIEREIGSVNGYPRAAKKYTVTGSEIELPDDCLQVLRVVPGDYEEEINVYYQTINDVLIAVDERTGEDIEYTWKPLNATYLNELFWEQVGNTLNLIDTYTDQEVTVIYTYLLKDDNGRVLVNESHIDAIKKYILYMLAKKYGWRIFKSDKMLRQGHLAIIETYRRDYSKAVRNARAADDSETPFETEQY